MNNPMLPKWKTYFVQYSSDINAPLETYRAPDPETAAEYFVEDNWDRQTEGSIECRVEDQIGNEWSVSVDVEVRPTFRGRA